jgi:hypothetical protein
MSGYRLFDVTSEVLIDRRRGAFRQQSDAFLDGSARRAADRLEPDFRPAALKK